MSCVCHTWEGSKLKKTLRPDEDFWLPGYPSVHLIFSGSIYHYIHIRTLPQLSHDFQSLICLWRPRFCEGVHHGVVVGTVGNRVGTVVGTVVLGPVPRTVLQGRHASARWGKGTPQSSCGELTGERTGQFSSC